MNNLITKLFFISKPKYQGRVINTKLSMSPQITGYINPEPIKPSVHNDNSVFATIPEKRHHQAEMISIHGYYIVNRTDQTQYWQVSFVLTTDNGQYIKSSEVIELKPGMVHASSSSLHICGDHSVCAASSFIIANDAVSLSALSTSQ